MCVHFGLKKCFILLCVATLAACQTNKEKSAPADAATGPAETIRATAKAKPQAQTETKPKSKPEPKPKPQKKLKEKPPKKPKEKAAKPVPQSTSQTTTANAEETETSKVRDPRPLWMRILFFWQKPPPPKAAPLRSIASVYTSNPAAGFAIIESPSAASLVPGTRLMAIDEGNVNGTVRISADRQPPFLIADILDGNLKNGDLLYIVDPE
ncbi:MAG: hypothetical protein ACK5LK_11580 [Chthoniobacterales bacterium]